MLKCPAPMLLTPKKLTVASFARFGEVLIASPRGEAGVGVNEGTARRYDRIASLQNLRPATASLNVAYFHCAPRTLPFTVATVEKHPFSSQLFVPMNASRYVVVVSLGGDAPDLETMEAFLVEGNQGVSYNPDVWHHTLMALDVETDFSCFVWEDGTPGDCVVTTLAESQRPQVNV